MSKMSQIHAATASDRADEAEREVARLKEVNAEMVRTLREARTFALNAIEDRVKLAGFDPTEHTLVKRIDAILARAEG
jgi:hypothetical protein